MRMALYVLVAVLLFVAGFVLFPQYGFRVILAPICTVYWVLGHLFGRDTIEYRGQTFKLSRGYIDYDDYKNDLNNIATHEVPRLTKIISEIPIEREFASEREFDSIVFGLAFPGYGGGGNVRALDREGGLDRNKTSDRIHARGIEIPGADATRWLVIAKSSVGRWHLVDDFIAPDNRWKHDPETIKGVQLVDGELVYPSWTGKVLRRTVVERLR
jgi:hypothetical protein